MSNQQSTKNKKVVWISVISAIIVVFVGVCSVMHFTGNTSASKAKKAGATVDGQTKSKVSKQSTTEQQETKKPTETTTKKPTTTKQGRIFVEPKIIKVDKDKWYLTCVNREYGVDKTYMPKLTPLTISPNDPRPTNKAKSQKMDYRVAPQYQKMYNDAIKDGIYLTPYSGYRSVSFQAAIFDNHVAINRKNGFSINEAKYRASEVVLPPGTSEHNLGLAIDIICVEKSFENSKEYKWLDKHAQDYGFILRYQRNKTNITNITYEPWHWRYVGVEDAKKIKAQGVCLEEYLHIK